MKTRILSILVFCISFSNIKAQQHFFYGVQLDYGSFFRNFDNNRDIIKGANLGRMLNLRLSGSYRIFDALTIEAGAGLNGHKWKMEDVDFAKRNPGFEATILTHNRYLSYFGAVKYSMDLHRKRYMYLRTGFENSSIGSKSLLEERFFEQGGDFASITQNYGQSNFAVVPEIGYEWFNKKGNLVSLGFKYHYKTSGDNLLVGNYYLNNQKGVIREDAYTLNGSYMALTFQINGLIKYIPKKEKVEKIKKIKPADTTRKDPEPVLVETKVDTTKPVDINDKKANDRDYAVTNKIKVQSTKVKIYVYDHQIEDGDRINLILNDDWILTDYTLKNKQHMITVELQPGTNKLILYALNLGKYKPNTAAIVVDDGTKKQQVVLESTLDESSALEIKVDK